MPDENEIVPEDDTQVQDASVDTPSTDEEVSSEAQAETTAEPAETMESVVEAALEAQPDAEEALGEPPADSEADKAEPVETEVKAEADTDTSSPDDTIHKSEADDDLPDIPDDAELKAATPKARKRISRLLEQRYEARQQVEALQPDASAYREIRQFMDANQLQDADVQTMFTFGRELRKGNFDGAMQVLQPYLEVLNQATGRAVPQDMQDRIENGEITEEYAKQLAKERINAQVQQQHAEQSRAQMQTQQTVAQQHAITQEGNAWETEKRAADPDFDVKAETVKAHAISLMQRYGRPNTPQQARQLAEDAYAEANKVFAAARPAKTSTRQALQSGGSKPSGGTSPAPSSLEEAIKQGLAAGAAG